MSTGWNCVACWDGNEKFLAGTLSFHCDSFRHWFAHDVEIAGGNGEEEFVGALSSFVCPDAHGDGGNEDEHDEGEPTIELIEVGEVGIKKVVRQKCRDGTEQHEDADEDIACRIGKIADEVAFENGV